MKKSKRLLTFLIWLSLFTAGGCITALFGLYLYLSPQLPAIDALKDIRFQTPLRVYSLDKKLIGEFGEKRRTPIRYQDIPEGYLKAILAAEDDQFYSHSGVSIKGLLRATSQLVSSGHIQSGGSTITMQVARNFFLSKRQTFARKFNEIFLALKIEKELSKEEILELYVNVIFLGNRAYGIEAAAQVYYGKTLRQLSLAQLAMIAGLPKAPSTFNPIVNPERALTRRNWILGRMLELGSISPDQYQLAVNEALSAKVYGSKLGLYAPYIAEMARKKAVKTFGLKAYTEGYKVFTTIDSELQKNAQNAVVNGLIEYDQRHGYRGPEHNLLGDKTATTTVTPELQEQWIQYLANMTEYGNLTPAAVIQVNDKDISVVLATGEQATIFWEQGLSSARRYVTENARSASPKSADEIAKIGDIIRLQFDENKGWTFSQLPDVQAALVALSPSNGAIKSLVGGFDFKYSHFNRATQAKRQPGSNFKPFIYTAALENGLSAASIINDAPIVFDDDALESTWRPENDNGKFYGPTRLRKALYLSRNLVSIRLLQNIGIQNAIETISKFGFNSKELPKDLSLSLGSHAVTPMDIATGYATFANGGYKISPYLIQTITNTDGTIVYEAKPNTACHKCDETPLAPIVPPDEGTHEENVFNIAEEVITPPFTLNFETKRLINRLDIKDYPRAEKILDDDVAFIINDILKDVIKRGTGRKARSLGRNDLAGKTGTTNGPTDAWFSGYQRELVTTTWVGFDQNTPLGRREYGGSAALPIWIEFMQTALKGKPEYKPEQPNDIVMVKIDPETGKRARTDDPDGIFEIFRQSNVPKLVEQEQANPWGQNEESIQEELF